MYKEKYPTFSGVRSKFDFKVRPNGKFAKVSQLAMTLVATISNIPPPFLCVSPPSSTFLIEEVLRSKNLICKI